jgi:hypothetical protein
MKRVWILLPLVFLCIAIVSCKDFQSNDLEFSPNEWQKSDARVRGRMYGDLLKQRLLLGKTRDEVIEMLGEPDHSELDFVKYAIDLGGINETWMQKYYLIVFFDKQTNKVIKATPID